MTNSGMTAAERREAAMQQDRDDVVAAGIDRRIKVMISQGLASHEAHARVFRELAPDAVAAWSRHKIIELREARDARANRG